MACDSFLILKVSDYTGLQIAALAAPSSIRSDKRLSCKCFHFEVIIDKMISCVQVYVTVPFF